VLAFPNVFHFFAHKLTRLSRRGFAFALVFARPFNCFFFWHIKNVSPLTMPLDVLIFIHDSGWTPSSHKSIAIVRRD
jgi:hypothetical protein